MWSNGWIILCKYIHTVYVNEEGTCFSYTFRTAVDMSPHICRRMNLANVMHVSGYSPDRFGLEDLDELPRSSSKPINKAQARLFLNMIQYCVPGRSHVPAVPSGVTYHNDCCYAIGHIFPWRQELPFILLSDISMFLLLWNKKLWKKFLVFKSLIRNHFMF